MKVQKILYATDIEASDDAELEPLITFRKLGLEEVIFSKPGHGNDLEKRIGDYGLKATRLGNGRISLYRMMETAEKESVSMIAVGLKSESGRVLQRSLLKGLLKASARPVLILKKGGQGTVPFDHNVFHHVVFATDWSLASEAALRYLLDFIWR